MADFEVGRDRLGEDPDAGDPQVELRGQQLGSRRECGVPDAAPEIGFVGKVRAQGIGRETQPVGQREIKAQVLELRTDRGVRGQVEGLGREARSDRGQDRRVDQPGPRSGLLDPGYRFPRRRSWSRVPIRPPGRARDRRTPATTPARRGRRWPDSRQSRRATPEPLPCARSGELPDRRAQPPSARNTSPPPSRIAAERTRFLKPTGTFCRAP